MKVPPVNPDNKENPGGGTKTTPAPLPPSGGTNVPLPPSGGAKLPPLHPNGGGYPRLPPYGGGRPPVIVILGPQRGRPVEMNSVKIGQAQLTRNGGSDIEAQSAEEWGMKITQLAPSGAAAAANLKVGHIIVSVGDQRVQSFSELSAILAQTSGGVEFLVYIEETQQYAKTTVTPANGKIGVAAEPVVLK